MRLDRSIADACARAARRRRVLNALLAAQEVVA